MKKHFTIEIQPDAHTRWIVPDDVLIGLIAREVFRVVRSATGGPVPAVRVVREQCNCEICSAQTCQPESMRG